MRLVQIEQMHALGDADHRVQKGRVMLEIALSTLPLVLVHQAEHISARPGHTIALIDHVHPPHDLIGRAESCLAGRQTKIISILALRKARHGAQPLAGRWLTNAAGA